MDGGDDTRILVDVEIKGVSSVIPDGKLTLKAYVTEGESGKPGLHGYVWGN